MIFVFDVSGAALPDRRLATSRLVLIGEVALDSRFAPTLPLPTDCCLLVTGAAAAVGVVVPVDTVFDLCSNLEGALIEDGLVVRLGGVTAACSRSTVALLLLARF